MKFLCPSCERITEIAAFRADGGALALRCSKCGVETREAIPDAAAGASLSAPPGPVTLSPSPRMPAPPALPPSPSVATRPAAVEAPFAAATPAPAPAPAPATRTEEEAPARVAFLRAVSPNAAYPASRPDPFEVPANHCPKCISLKRMNGPACASCGLVFAVFNPAEHAPAPAIAKAWQELVPAWEDNTAHDRFLQLAMAQNALAAAGRLYRIQLAHNPDDPYAARGRDEVFRLASVASPLAVVAAERRAKITTKRAQYWLLAGTLTFLLIVLAVLFRTVGSA